MANQSATATLDRAFAALADPTRRAVIERLQRGPATMSELARQHPMALPSFMKHFAVLTDAGLVTSTKRGRVRECRLERAVLDETARWIDERRRVWNTRLDALDTALKGNPE
jgi:DNA-binding transcriptional ArsR family regulator